MFENVCLTLGMMVMLSERKFPFISNFEVIQMKEFCSSNTISKLVNNSYNDSKAFRGYLLTRLSTTKSIR